MCMQTEEDGPTVYINKVSILNMSSLFHTVQKLRQRLGMAINKETVGEIKYLHINNDLRQFEINILYMH